jgi:hypothetical protein
MSWQCTGKKGQWMQLTRRIPIGTKGHYLVQELLVEEGQTGLYLGRKRRKKRRLRHVAA